MAAPLDERARAEAILRKRAAAAATARDEVRDPEARLLTFRGAGELFAVNLDNVTAISLIRSMTPLPGAPRALAGLLNVRGRHVTAIDLGLLLGAAASSQRRIVDAGKAVTVGHEGREVALIAEELSGIVEVFAGDLKPITGIGASDPIRAMGPGGLHVLDVPALFLDARLSARMARGAR